MSWAKATADIALGVILLVALFSVGTCAYKSDSRNAYYECVKSKVNADVCAKGLE